VARSALHSEPDFLDPRDVWQRASSDSRIIARIGPVQVSCRIAETAAAKGPECISPKSERGRCGGVARSSATTGACGNFRRPYRGKKNFFDSEVPDRPNVRHRSSGRVNLPECEKTQDPLNLFGFIHRVQRDENFIGRGRCRLGAPRREATAASGPDELISLLPIYELQARPYENFFRLLFACTLALWAGNSNLYKSWPRCAPTGQGHGSLRHLRGSGNAADISSDIICVRLLRPRRDGVTPYAGAYRPRTRTAFRPAMNVYREALGPRNLAPSRRPDHGRKCRSWRSRQARGTDFFASRSMIRVGGGLGVDAFDQRRMTVFRSTTDRLSPSRALLGNQMSRARFMIFIYASSNFAWCTGCSITSHLAGAADCPPGDTKRDHTGKAEGRHVHFRTTKDFRRSGPAFNRASAVFFAPRLIRLVRQSLVLFVTTADGSWVVTWPGPRSSRQTRGRAMGS